MIYPESLLTEIDFDIDIIPDTHPISIPSYKTSPLQLKNKLKDILEKGFILPNKHQETSKFQWSEVCENSFQEMKKKLTSNPLLTLPESTQVL